MFRCDRKHSVCDYQGAHVESSKIWNHLPALIRPRRSAKDCHAGVSVCNVVRQSSFSRINHMRVSCSPCHRREWQLLYNESAELELCESSVMLPRKAMTAVTRRVVRCIFGSCNTPKSLLLHSILVQLPLHLSLHLFSFIAVFIPAPCIFRVVKFERPSGGVANRCACGHIGESA
jgi:hypothetical protein